MPPRAAPAKEDLSISLVVELRQRWPRRDTVRPDRIGGAKRSALAAHAERVRAPVAADLARTLAELALDVGALRPVTRAGLSLGDCCLALARRLRLAVLTTEARLVQLEAAAGVIIRSIGAKVS